MRKYGIQFDLKKLKKHLDVGIFIFENWLPYFF